MLDEESFLRLPAVPAAQAGDAVAAWREAVTIDTYLPAAPDRYPAYLENRVYQGSSGRIYPLPFHERIEQSKRPRQWDAIHIENEWVRLMVLPELGGRIHVGLDKSNGYDFFYRNNVIKPALVGLAGPWISGGVEFNWPQHHRPATFLPVETHIEHEADGSVTVWCADLDPFARMKGMHGIRLRPASNLIELRVRLFNRTEDVQTFLWWANAAALVNDDYQSFFPTDVHFVADHAKRAVTAFPRADRPYYGIDYPGRVGPDAPDADGLDWYRNIPVPTSYMCLGTQDDFFGGYDHGVRAGFVHWADHRIAPGKKQWTWGNSPFGWAWDDNLTDGDGPYVELMAGVYTDNQPDFTFLAPGETKSFSQYWYPFRQIGPVHQANLDVAVRLDVSRADVPVGRPDTDTAPSTRVGVGSAFTAARRDVEARLIDRNGEVLWSVRADVDPAHPIEQSVELDGSYGVTDLTLVVVHDSAELIRWTHREAPADVVVPDPAREPSAPQSIASTDELHLTAVHLEQYRHATRSPEPYWEEVLRRDSEDSRANLALGVRRLRAGRYQEAERFLRTALSRQTRLNPNPADGEVSYQLARVLERTSRSDEAYDTYGKAAWAAAWRAPAWLAMARLDAARGRDLDALGRARDVLAAEPGQLQARAIVVLMLRRLGTEAEAKDVLRSTLEADPLDWWMRDLAGDEVDADAPILVDVALEYASLGELDDAVRMLERAAALPTVPGQVAVAPLAHYHRADLLLRAGRTDAAALALQDAREADLTYCLASRLDDVDMLTRIVADHPEDSRARALLGHWMYFERRYDEAIALWRSAVDIDGGDAVVRRNLAVAEFNVLGRPAEAAAWYERALEASPRDPRLVYESDQLAKRIGVPPTVRLDRMTEFRDVVDHRDDLTVELVELLTATDRAAEALEILRERRFQPWEGGEGRVINARDEALLSRSRDAMAVGDARAAVGFLDEALSPPRNLGEARHPLANFSHLLLALGDARQQDGDADGAREAWTRAATSAGDFQSMNTLPYSEMTYFSVLASRRLGDTEREADLVAGLESFVRTLREEPAVVDYFATSLPTMLLFTEDVQATRDTTVLLLEAQVALLAGDRATAGALIDDVLDRDPSQVRALDMRRELAGLSAGSAR
ncbi:DUF5107 domain-containing protein [Isoptericola sp. F-RaC21]|uniref:DUF5107 domain-containing protein n=1 Tax=Isoptericola sp. F-RaC21 TaxID=3141452 RepID=UPI00315C09CC